MRGDYDNVPEAYRARRRLEQQSGFDRRQRLRTTMVVGAAVFLILGFALGFGIGRVTAPKPEPQVVAQPEPTMTAGVVEEVPTETIDPDSGYGEETTESVEVTAADDAPPPTPKQTSPSNGASVSGSRVYLRWTKVEDESAVTYAFEIQDLKSNGSWGNTQTIKDLTATSYSARVLNVKRRWRVWAVDSEGNASKKSGWRTYTKKTATVSVSPSNPATSSASDETT